MGSWINVGVIFISCFLTTGIWAAPIPATSSSSLISADLGLFISKYGFSIHASNTSWIQSEPPKGIPNLSTLYKSPQVNQGVQASLTVRVDRVKDTPNLRTYVHRWMKDYHRLGFDILATKPVKVSGQEGYLVDLLNREAEKQLRQVVFLKNDTAVVLTCRDHRDTFVETAKTCTEIMRNFRWTR